MSRKKKKVGPQMPLLNDCEKFREMVERYFSFLETYGVRRAPEHDYASPVSCRIIYKAKTFWIIVYLDIRDNYVGVDMMAEDGFRKDIYFYLKDRFGSIEKPPIHALSSPIETAIAFGADLLRLYADRLFAE